AFDQVLPGRRIGVLEISHEDVGAAIERVDHHLAVGRAGDLDPAILNVAWYWGYPPITGADRLGFRQEIRFPPCVEPLLQFSAARQKPLSLGAEPPFELNREGDSLGAQHPLVTGLDRRADGDARKRAGGFGHADISRSNYLPSAARAANTKTAFERSL